MIKKCADCNESKNIELFVKDKRKHNGYRNRCKSCENLRRRKTPVPPIPKEGFKFCAHCKEEKKIEEFNKRIYAGEKRPYSYCKPCERKRDRSRHPHKCAMCGLEYTSSVRNVTYCKKCHDTHFIKTYSILSTLDQSGKNNPMYGVRRFGEENPNYKPEKTPEEREEGRLLEGYGVWRKEVYERDNYTCQVCSSNAGGTLEAHHKDGYNWCVERRLDVSNGITCCETCHNDFHNKYGRGNNTEKQFEEYISLKKALL
jgi:hypothetical protein